MAEVIFHYVCYLYNLECQYPPFPGAWKHLPTAEALERYERALFTWSDRNRDYRGFVDVFLCLTINVSIFSLGCYTVYRLARFDDMSRWYHVAEDESISYKVFFAVTTIARNLLETVRRLISPLLTAFRVVGTLTATIIAHARAGDWTSNIDPYVFGLYSISEGLWERTKRGYSQYRRFRSWAEDNAALILLYYVLAGLSFLVVWRTTSMALHSRVWEPWVDAVQTWWHFQETDNPTERPLSPQELYPEFSWATPKWRDPTGFVGRVPKTARIIGVNDPVPAPGMDEHGYENYRRPSGKTFVAGDGMIWCATCRQTHCCEVPY